MAVALREVGLAGLIGEAQSLYRGKLVALLVVLYRSLPYGVVRGCFSENVCVRVEYVYVGCVLVRGAALYCRCVENDDMQHVSKM